MQVYATNAVETRQPNPGPLKIKSNSAEILLRIEDLKTYFDTDDGVVPAVDGVSFSLQASETLGVVGESGCGKSVTALSVMGLVPPRTGRHVGGKILFGGADLTAKSASQMRLIRGNLISMIFQEPMSSLNPVFTVGSQIVEAVKLHQNLNTTAARTKAVDMLNRVGIPSPRQRLKEYPHQMSGGMRQRVMIAMALVCKPRLLIADEPTTALDVTVQAQILKLMMDLKQELGMAIMLITHDLGVVAEISDRVAVMYAGKVVEYAATQVLFERPAHPYTQGLLGSIPTMTREMNRLTSIEGNVPDASCRPAGCAFHPRCPHCIAICREQEPRLMNPRSEHTVRCWLLDPDGAAHDKKTGDPSGRQKGLRVIERRTTPPPDTEQVSGNPAALNLLEVKDLVKYFPVGGKLWGRPKQVRAVDGISFAVVRGETLGLVGESGCGKTTTGRLILRILDPTSGRIFLEGRDFTDLNEETMRPLRRDIQTIFQDPFGSLNPRMTVGRIIGEALSTHGIARGRLKAQKVQGLLEIVGLDPFHIKRYPHEFSGGQRQRIGVARALALNPKLVICDEPVSALDVSIQAQIVNLLQDLQAQFNLTYLFISHDLSLVKHISNRVAVMYLGKIVELAPKNEIYDNPRHPYTQALLAAIPVADPTAKQRPDPRSGPILLKGDVPSPIDPPRGCRFHTRCPYTESGCEQQEPIFEEISPEHYVACHRKTEELMH